MGLTATPERLDRKKLEDIFGHYKTNLTLREAIDKDVITNIRCYRLLSNVDLSAVRYNGKDYNYADLEKTLIVDSRNELIVRTLKKYFYPREGFCKRSILANPFEKFERKRFVYYSKDLNILSFNPALWEQMSAEVKEGIREKEKGFLERYYKRLGGG